MRLSDILKKTSQPQETKSPEPQQKPAPAEQSVISRIQQKPQEKPAPAAHDKAETPSSETNISQNCEDIYYNGLLDIKTIILSLEQSKENPKTINSIPKFIEALQKQNEHIMLFTIKCTPDTYIYAHSVNICILSLFLGITQNLSIKMLNNLGYCSILQDFAVLNKLNIRLKSGKLQSSDYLHIKKYLPNDMEIIKMIPELKETIKSTILKLTANTTNINYSFELMNSETVESFVNIITIAMIYETLIHPYNPQERLIPHDAIKTIISNSEIILNDELIKSFVKTISIYPLGSYVRLNTDEIARVIKINKDLPTRPKVQLIASQHLARIEQAKTIDLSESPMIFIKEAVDETKINFTDKKLALELKAMRWWVKGI